MLEGKYWKRQSDVIKAEYMKWRKFHRNRGLGNHALMDTVEYMFLFYFIVEFFLFEIRK